MLSRIAVSAYCHAQILGLADVRARDVADRVFGELFPEVSDTERRAILDREIAMVELRGVPLTY